MKKIVILILLILPFVLSIMISLTGKIISLTTYIAVESISFVDEFDKDIDNTVVIKVGDEYTPIIKVLPALANNKKYSLYVNPKHDSILKIEEGKVVGLSHGFAEVVVISDYDSNILDKLVIKVSNEDVQSVNLTHTEVTLNVGESYTIDAYVLPETATNKMLHFTSSDESVVTVDALGKVEVKSYSATPVTITVTSDADNTKQAIFTINIDTEESSFVFIPVREGVKPYIMLTNTLDLMSILYYDTQVIDVAQIKFSISGGKEAGATLSGSVVTVTTPGVLFRAKAVCGNYTADIFIKLG